ncbi:MAG TPA: serine hydrolase domain-containing protein [Candidatus Dormibacteraeota bacterium]|nr:serine hydrolase domain-containing protein [Candidatus Dormibacteraeota bacterium]
MREAIAQRAFPAASIAITHAGQLIARKAFGHFVYEEDLKKVDLKGAPLLPDFGRSEDFDVDVSTLFDLASLTKPIATTTMAMILHDRGLLELDAPLIGTMPEFLVDSCGQADPRRHHITFRMLLAHSSGLPAYEKLFLKAHSRDELLIAAVTTPLSADPGTRAEYSDIGFIVLAAALERIAEEPLDVFCQREIFGPLALSNTTFNPPVQIRGKIPPTADEREQVKCGAGTPAREMPAANPQPGVSLPQPRSTFRNRIIQGEVQDENASILGGVAGHAGLFSTAEDLASFAHAMLECDAGTPAREGQQLYQSIVHPETISLFTRRDSTPGTSRALGWDTPSSPSQSGEHFGPRSFGHLGYTGTSLWIDPDRQLSITLLTNRTWPDCANQAIKQVRPRFHDAVIEALR